MTKVVCKDELSSCSRMTRYCTYKSYEEYMKQNCQSSCGFCSGGGQGIKNNDFDRSIPISAMGFSRKKMYPPC